MNRGAEECDNIDAVMSRTLFYPIAANAADYPKPILPLLAQPSWNGFFNHSGQPEKSAFIGNGESFLQSRYALAEAMHRAGVEPGKVVLLPAFHCRVIVESVLSLGAEPCFYPVTPDLKPDFSLLMHLLQERKVSFVAMVLTHYFGFPNAVKEAEQFCKANGIVLIEDCAHALYGQAEGRVLGCIGSYAVASLWKFLPVRSGAVLLDNTCTREEHHLSRPPVMEEIKSIGRVIETWLKRRTTGRSLPLLDASALADKASKITQRHVESEPDAGLREFNTAFAAVTAHSTSRWFATMVSHAMVANRRRANYKLWLEGIRTVAGVKPLFPDLPEHVVPYAFPLLVDSEGLMFHLLKLAGVPMWRWEDMAVTNCSVSKEYRLRLLQLPCHQDLHSSEIEWLIRSVQDLAPEAVK